MTSQVIDPKSLHDQSMFGGDHVRVAIMREMRAQSIAWLRRLPVPYIVGKDDVHLRGVEQTARPEKNAGELRPKELMPVAAGAVEDEDRIGHPARGVAHGLSERRIVKAQAR